ncbi:MAG: M28 family peptidase [Magnetococcus sp. WYHC-3]
MLTAALLLAGWEWTMHMPGRSYALLLTDQDLTPMERVSRQRLKEDLLWLTGERGGARDGSGDATRDRVAYLEGQFRAAGWRVTRLPLPGPGPAATTLEARGAGGTLQTAPVVVGAHYDAAPNSPGADANAAAVAVLLELARLLEPDTAVVFPLRLVAFARGAAPWSGTPHQGSRMYLNNLANPRLVLSLTGMGVYSDLPGTQHWPGPVGWMLPRQGNFLGFFALAPHRGLLHRVLGEFRQGGVFPSLGLVVPTRGWSLPQDPFQDLHACRERNLPCVLLSDTGPWRQPHYAGPEDRPEAINLAALTLVARELARTLQSLVNVQGP